MNDYGLTHLQISCQLRFGQSIMDLLGVVTTAGGSLVMSPLFFPTLFFLAANTAAATSQVTSSATFKRCQQIIKLLVFGILAILLCSVSCS